MIPALGAGGPGFNPRLRPVLFAIFLQTNQQKGSQPHHYSLSHLVEVLRIKDVQ